MPITVLVADDEERIRNIVKYTLEEAGFEVELAEDSERAFRKLSLNDFDMVVMDVNMPGINGIEGIRSMKIIKEDQKIVVLTGYCLETMKENTLRAGADDCLFKPHGIKELPGVISRILEGDKE